MVTNLIFNEIPQQIISVVKTSDSLTLNKILEMNNKRILRDKCLISTSSDNMHHV